ncbi:hypothetical protein Aperf_G00000011418 [Anoplocephala perfoliata]
MSIPSTNQRSFLKDVQQLYRIIDTSTDGQAAVESVDDTSVRISLLPKTGCNAHATFLMTINCSPGYPAKVPDVRFETPIYHPNICGEVCLSLFWEWRACYSLLDVVKAILYLIDHPNFESNLNEYVEADGALKLATKSARLLAGLPVGGVRFPPNTSWCEWARANKCLPTEEEENDSYIWTPPTDGGATASVVSAIPEEATISTSQIVESLGRGDLSPDAQSDDFSESIRSYIKPRHSIEDSNCRDFSSTYSQYYNVPTTFALGMHRIIIWQPTCGDTMEFKSLFYYAEVLCDAIHLQEIGVNYPKLFKGSLLHEAQVKSEFRQSSKTFMWAPYCEEFESCVSWDDSSLHKFNLNLLFVDEKPRRHLTSDFCPWSKEDGLGIHDLFGTLFLNRAEPRSDFTCFLDKESETDATSDGIGGFFDSENVDPVGEFEYGGNCLDEDSIGEQSVFDFPSQSDSHLDKNNSSEVTSTNSHPVKPHSNNSMKLCFICNSAIRRMLGIINGNLSGDWAWNFRQTRWPIRFAPQQSVELTVDGVLLPPWRVSAGRLLHDVNQYCAKNCDIQNLILLDPMSISPLSPLLNLMRQSTTPSGRLTGVLWMTPLQALSPNFHVPIPPESSEENVDMEDVRERGEMNGYPSAFTLRFLTLDAYLTNWASWISRIEVYSALGFSRPLSKYVTDAVSAYLLQPFNLGCGAAPIVDLWPLWLFRNILKLSLHVPQLITSLRSLICFKRSHSTSNTRFLFPFTDIDEI